MTSVTPSSTVTMNSVPTLASNSEHGVSTISTYNNTIATTPKDYLLVYILVPASIIALVGFGILAYLIVRCFRELNVKEDVVHLTGKDHAEDSEHHMFSLFNPSYNGTNSNDHTAAKDRKRKRSIFEMNEEHIIKRQDPAYIDIDIPIDMQSSDDDKVTRRTNETNLWNKTNSKIESKTGESTYDHIVINNDEGIYNRLTLKNHDQKASQHVKSTFEDVEYDNSAVVKSYKTFESSYSRLSNVTPRKNPFLRLMEELDDNVDTSAKWSQDNETSDSTKKSSETVSGNGKQMAKQKQSTDTYSKVNKTSTVERRPETMIEKKNVTENERNETNKSKQEKGKCSNDCPDNIKAFDVSADCSKLTDKNGYSIVNKHISVVQSKGKEENKIEEKAGLDRNRKSSRKDEYSEVMKKEDKSCKDFPCDGIEIHTDKFFIVTDS